MSRAEALLKVILSPVDSVADTYRALFPEGTLMEFQRILELKVILPFLNPFPRSQANWLETGVPVHNSTLERLSHPVTVV